MHSCLPENCVVAVVSSPRALSFCLSKVDALSVSLVFLKRLKPCRRKEAKRAAAPAISDDRLTHVTRLPFLFVFDHRKTSLVPNTDLYLSTIRENKASQRPCHKVRKYMRDTLDTGASKNLEQYNYIFSILGKLPKANFRQPYVAA